MLNIVKHLFADIHIGNAQLANTSFTLAQITNFKIRHATILIKQARKKS